MNNFINPIAGKLVNLKKVPDKVFSKKMVGDGYAIEPKDGRVYSPVEGEIIVFSDETKHAYGIKDKDGNEWLIHLGLDTVELKGYGFTSHVIVGQKVNQGQLIAEMDLKAMKGEKVKTVSMVLLTNIKKGSFIPTKPKNVSVALTEVE